MSRYTVIASWQDAPHLSAEARAELEAAYLPHERDARTKGIPSLGAGAIYPVSESDVVCDPFEIPEWYRQCYGFDVGWNRTAAIWGALDPESDILYFYSEHYRGQAEPAVHAQAVLARGRWIPGVIDPAARGRGQKDGEALLGIYKELSLNIEKADNTIEAGIYAVWSRLSCGKLKAFKTLQNWLAEFRIYRRDEKGAVVKANDHLMDASRYLVMSGLDRAIARPSLSWQSPVGMGREADYDSLPYFRTNRR
jgi:hypothetical protein